MFWRMVFIGIVVVVGGIFLSTQLQSARQGLDRTFAWMSYD